MIKLNVAENEAHRVVIPEFLIFVTFLRIFWGKPPIFVIFGGLSTLASKPHWLCLCDPQMKCRGRLDASMVEITASPTRGEHLHFWGKLPILLTL